MKHKILTAAAIALVTSPLWLFAIYFLWVAPLITLACLAFLAAVLWALRYLDDNPDGGVD